MKKIILISVLFLFTIFTAIVILPHKVYSQSTTVTVVASNADSATKSSANYVADGTDDQVKIQQAINSLGAIGGTVTLSSGTFNLTSMLEVKTNVVLQGQGDSTILQVSPNSKADRIVWISGSNTKLISLSVHDGRTLDPNLLVDGVRIFALNNVIISSVIIDHVKVIGIHSTGIMSSDANHIQITNCQADDIRLSAIALVKTDDSLVDHCLVTNTGDHGILSTRGNRNTISNNTVKNSGIKRDGKEFCRAITIDGDYGKYHNSGHKIINNYIENAYQGAIELADGISDTLVDNNTVNGSGLGASPTDGFGIWAGGGYGAAHGITISNNKIYNARHDDGVRIKAWREDPSFNSDVISTDIKIIGNEVANSDRNGIKLENVDNFTVQNNLSYNNDKTQTDNDGIQLLNVNNGTVQLNHSYDNQTSKTQNFGLTFLGQVANVNVHDNILAGNQFADTFVPKEAVITNVTLATTVASGGGAEIQQAIDSIQGLTSGTVTLGAGTFNIPSTITLRANTVFQGQGESTILQAVGNLNWRIVLINGSNTKLTSLAIHDGRPAPNPADITINAVHIAGDNGVPLNNVTVSNLKITDIYSAGIEADSPGKNYQLINNYMENIGNGSGVDIVGIDDSLIDHNTIIKTGGPLLWQAHGIRSSRGNRNIISNNVIKKSCKGQDGRGFCRAITIDGDDYHFPNSGHKIINNYMEDSYQGAIELADGVSGTLIDGNTIKGAGLGSVPLDGWGIWIGGGFGPESHITISNNKISNTSQQGIFVFAFSSTNNDINIMNNDISYGGQSGISLAHTNTFVIKDNKVYDNHQKKIEGIRDGVRLTDSSNGVVSGNHVFDDQVNKTQDYGLGEGVVNNITQTNNDLAGNRIGEIYSDPNLTTSIPQLLCSVLNLGSIDADREYTFDVTFQGYPTSAELWYSPTSKISGVQIGQSCNVTPGNPSSCSWKTKFSTLGSYYIFCNAANAQTRCQGNPQINGNDSCGASSHQFVSVNTLMSSPTPTLTSLPGDLNHDNKVNISDYNILLQNFGNAICGNISDIDGNCKVNIFDYNILMGNFGKAQ